jgi:DNA-binding transcriptional MocR family regulator
VQSVSKSLGPDLRLAALRGDDVTVGRVEGRLRAGPGWVSHLLQSLVADLWCDAPTERRVERAAAAYEERRGSLVDALAAHGIAGHARSGLNVWVPVPNEEVAVTGLLAAGWAVSAGERFRVRTGPAIRVSVATLAPAEASGLADDLAAVLAPGRAASTSV